MNFQIRPPIKFSRSNPEVSARAVHHLPMANERTPNTVAVGSTSPDENLSPTSSITAGMALLKVSESPSIISLQANRDEVQRPGQKPKNCIADSQPRVPAIDGTLLPAPSSALDVTSSMPTQGHCEVGATTTPTPAHSLPISARGTGNPLTIERGNPCTKYLAPEEWHIKTPESPFTKKSEGEIPLVEKAQGVRGREAQSKL